MAQKHSKRALDDALAALRRDVPLTEALSIVHETGERLGEDFFAESALPLREAWVAANFGLLAEYSHLRLAAPAQKGFDVTLRYEGGVREFDVTEAMDRTRDRVAEFRSTEGTIPNRRR